MRKRTKIAKPDFQASKDTQKAIRSADSQLRKIISSEGAQRALITKAVQTLQQDRVRTTLEGLDVEQLNKDKQGIRVSALKKAGISNVWQVSSLSAKRLCSIPGIGEASAVKIRASVSQIVSGVKSSTRLRLSPENRSAADDALVQALYVYIGTAEMRPEASSLYEANHGELEKEVRAAKRAKNAFFWTFSSRAKKEKAVESLQTIRERLDGPFGQQSGELISRYRKLAAADSAVCWEDFAQRAPRYYACLESAANAPVDTGKVQSGLPEQLAEAVNACPIELRLMKSALRSYQLFGSKYVLQQRRVLLGDEMGLGKTVEAIAAMASLQAGGSTHFMVVCPAGVLTNWCREIERHSSLLPVKIHGGDGAALDSWVQNGGAAVTTYESISKFELPASFSFAMLVADEAHYVKNPEALRTRSLQKLLQRTDRVLFMTGTPLENNVDEMCFLVSCLQPPVARELEGIKYLSAAPQFREKLAPVYLRRTREDVLQELPELIDSEEWCELGETEKQAYARSVMAGDFMAMRQLSWQQSDLRESSKAQRLLEICEQAAAEGRKVIVFSYFLNTIRQVRALLGEHCLEPITGALSSDRRQEIIDEFSKAENGSVLVSQVQAGGTGLNIQAASVVVFCEPQLKPSTENQAVSRAYRMGQIRNVLVYHLLCEDSVDERIVELLKTKQNIFDQFADESVIGTEAQKLDGTSAAKKIVDEEKARLLSQPA